MICIYAQSNKLVYIFSRLFWYHAYLNNHHKHIHTYYTGIVMSVLISYVQSFHQRLLSFILKTSFTLPNFVFLGHICLH